MGPIVAWAVWYSDGSVRRSSSWDWHLLPRDGVQVVMFVHPPRDGGAVRRRTRVANCDEYAHPESEYTLLGEEIEFGEYERISDEALVDEWRG